MKCIAKIAIPFTLTLVLGLIVARLFVSNVSTLKVPDYIEGPRLAVLSVPKIAFTEEATQSPGLQASIKLRAEVNSGGRVIKVRPSRMLPYGISDSASRQGELAKATSSLLNGRFVDHLPYQLTESAIYIVRGIEFNSDRGTVGVTEVDVLVEFNVTKPHGFPLCNPIVATVTDDDGTIWRGNASVYAECAESRSEN